MESLEREFKHIEFSGSKKQSILETFIRTNDQEDSFYIADMSQLKYKINQWNTLMPKIRPFYAVKCNPDTEMIKILQNMGCGFDCASPFEIDLCLKLGIDPYDIIYANPCKPKSNIIYAKNHNINLTTFDNEEEMIKIKKYHPNCKVVLRILTDDSKSVCRLGLKYGANVSEFVNLIQKCAELELDLVGISFHVGSGCYDASMYKSAIKLSHKCFQIACAYNFEIKLLDIGGGYPGSNDELFREIAKTVNTELDYYYPKGMQFIAEPGRYMASSIYTLSVNIFSKKIISNPNTKESIYMYYVNDGLYGSFNCIPFDHAVVQAKVLRISTSKDYLSDSLNKEKYSVIWGPTCDSLDCISSGIMLPELEIGDWLYFEDMGAYTISPSSEFNGIPRSKIYYINN